MILNERKIKILEAIINDYIVTAEPIGSRTIAKKYNLGISSATIRNEMSDLEELGFIMQPHTSAGRVPSDKGYRLYVDRLMNFRELTENESEFLQEIIKTNINHIDYLMQQTAKALSLLTNYTTIVSEPKLKKIKIKHIQLIPFDEKSIVAVMVTDNKIVKNHVINVDKAPNDETLNEISNKLNEYLKNCLPEQIDSTFLDKFISDFGEYGKLVNSVFSAFFEGIKSKNDVHLYTSGFKNILAFPEFSDIEKAKILFQTFEEKDMLITLLGNNSFESNNSIQVLIGNENDMEQMKDCSIIRTDYTVGDGLYGSIGIIGPTRMDYSQVVSILTGIVKSIDIVIKALSGG